MTMNIENLKEWGVRINGEYHKIYMNGDEKASGSCSNVTHVPSYDLLIGDDYYHGDRHFVGSMRDFMIFNQALTSSQIKALYEATYIE